MKLQIISDLHLEFFKSKEHINNFVHKLLTDSDTLILAGDISVISNKKSKEYLLYFLYLITKHYTNIIYVLGNHEYYCGYFDLVLNDIKNNISIYNNIYVLENDHILLDNVNFFGTTLWFKESPQAILNTHLVNDFSYISNFNPYTANNIAVNFIQNINTNLNNVLITHHLPSYSSVNDKYLGELSNCYFVCDIEDQLNKFDVVIHGHTHSSCDYRLDKTRVICNPYGYNAQNTEFSFNCVIEVS